MKIVIDGREYILNHRGSNNSYKSESNEDIISLMSSGLYNSGLYLKEIIRPSIDWSQVNPKYNYLFKTQDGDYLLSSVRFNIMVISFRLFIQLIFINRILVIIVFNMLHVKQK